MSDWSNMHMQMDMEQLFSEEFFPQSEFEEFFSSEQWHRSSSSSSQQSLSMGSPESSSLKNSSSSSISDTLRKVPNYQETQIQGNYQYHDIKFPTMKSEDMVITKAISAIFSSASSTTSMLDQSLQQVQTNRNLVTSYSGFKSYNWDIPPKSEPKKKSCGQKMIKDSIAYLRKIDSMKDGAVNQESRPSGHQLHHMISERKRREKLNRSFYELRLLLPPSSKKDKASVLCKTKDYLKTLEAQIYEIEKKNQMLEMELLPTDETKEGVIGSKCSINVQIIEASEPLIGIRRINFKITVGVECDLIELVLHALEYLKEIRAISLVSIDANTYLQQKVQFTWATLKFDIKASDWDEVSFKKGMTSVVNIAILSP